jgi:hypothetical protein
LIAGTAAVRSSPLDPLESALPSTTFHQSTRAGEQRWLLHAR